MEVAGLAIGVVGLAGLFSTCVQLVEQIESTQTDCIARELHTLHARFCAAKHLLNEWGQAVGLDSYGIANTEIHSSKLADAEKRKIAFYILASLERLFENMEKLEKYGLMVKKVPSPDSSGTVAEANMKIDKFTKDVAKKISVPRRMIWVVKDKLRFERLLENLTTLVGNLYEVIPPAPAHVLAVDGLTKKLEELRCSIDGEAEGKIAAMSEAKQFHQDIRTYIKSCDHQEVLEWIGAVSTVQEYEDEIRERTRGTCKWVLEREFFLGWKHSPEHSPVLWIHGPPGSGKSVIAASIIEHLVNSTSYPVAYFICVHDDEDKKNPSSVLRSWVAQLSQQRTDAFLDIQRAREGKETRKPTEAELWKMLRTILLKIGRCFLVIDGLDECIDRDPFRRGRVATCGLREQFLADLLENIQSSSANVLIISRDEVDIRHSLLADESPEQAPNSNVVEYAIKDDDTRDDLQLFSRAIVQKRLGSSQKVLQESLADEICDNSDGMFLWVRLGSDRIQRGMTGTQLRRIIQELSPNLHALYQRDLEKILGYHVEDRKRAQDIFRWILFGVRPLTVRELSEAVLVDPNDKIAPALDELPESIEQDFIDFQILRLCGSLVVVRPNPESEELEDYTLHLVHYSVKEFIMEQWKMSTGNCIIQAFAEAEGQEILASTCITKIFSILPEIVELMEFRVDLEEDTERPGVVIVKSQPGDLDAVSNTGNPPFEHFARYSVVHWMDHVRAYENLGGSLLPGLKRMLSSAPEEPLWKAGDVADNVDSGDLDPFRICASLFVDGWPDCVLSSVIYQGTLTGCRFLVEERGFNVHLPNNPSAMGMALSSDRWVDRIQIVELIASLYSPKDGPGGEAQLCKEVARHASPNSLRIMWERFPCVSENGSSILKSALDNNNHDIVLPLVEYGCDPTPYMERAVKHSSVENLRVLIPKYPAPLRDNKILRDMCSELHMLRPGSDSLEIVSLLLSAGAGPISGCLSATAPRSNFKMANLLLEKGAHINDRAKVKDPYSGRCVELGTPLQIASMREHVAFVAFLLNRGADPNIDGPAVKWGCWDWFWCNKPEQWTADNWTSGTPEALARERGRWEIVNLLKSHGEGNRLMVEEAEKNWKPEPSLASGICLPND